MATKKTVLTMATKKTDIESGAYQPGTRRRRPGAAPVRPVGEPKTLRVFPGRIYLPRPGDAVELAAVGEPFNVDLETAVRALIADCPMETEWRLRVTAEQLEQAAARLRAEWLRRRGGQP